MRLTKLFLPFLSLRQFLWCLWQRKRSCSVSHLTLHTGKSVFISKQDLLSGIYCLNLNLLLLKTNSSLIDISWLGIHKGSPNFQGILNWKILKTYSLLNKMLLSLSVIIPVYWDFCFICLSQRQSFFSVLGHRALRNYWKFYTLHVIIRAVNTFIFSFFGFYFHFH